MPNTGPTAWNSPDYFVGKTQALSAYEPHQGITASNYSSLTPSQAAVVRWEQPAPLVVKNIVQQISLNAGVPGATSQASAGSEACSYALSAWIYSRVDYAANSSALTPVVSGTFGLTATMTYTSTSQLFGMSWVTDSAGGTSNLTTTSSDAGWSNFISGARAFNLPLGTTLPSGEYWFICQQNSSSATSNSNVTLLSVSQLQAVAQQGSAAAGYLGQTATGASVSGWGQNVGVITSTGALGSSFAISNISLPSARPIWFALSNA